MRIGELFAGIGGLGIGASWATHGSIAWQVEVSPQCAEVLRLRFPRARQVEADVREICGRDLSPVDLLCGGFPCQDLSVAGVGAGLDGERSGLYRELLRIAGELRPGAVLIENVPPLLRYRERIDCDLDALGYHTAWLLLPALAAGAPHHRRRAWVLARRPEVGRPACRRVEGAAWTSNSAVPWPTPCARDYRSGADNAYQARRQGSPGLCDAALGRLAPEWVEALMGLPAGWTDHYAALDEADAHALLDAPRWPAGWVREAADAGPQHEWEPRRLIFGRPMAGRPARLKALGNAVVPHHAARALWELSISSEQGVLL